MLPLEWGHRKLARYSEPTGFSEPPDCVSGLFIRLWPAGAEPARSELLCEEVPSTIGGGMLLSARLQTRSLPPGCSLWSGATGSWLGIPNQALHTMRAAPC